MVKVTQDKELFDLLNSFSNNLTKIGYRMLTPASNPDSGYWSITLAPHSLCKYCGYSEPKCTSLRNEANMTHCCIKCFEDISAHD